MDTDVATLIKLCKDKLRKAIGLGRIIKVRTSPNQTYHLRKRRRLHHESKRFSSKHSVKALR